MRIVGHPGYPNSPGSPAIVSDIVAKLRDLPGHGFWADHLSFAGSELFDACQFVTSARVTDSYLLGLAAAHGGKLATFDRRLSTRAVRRGKAALHLIADAAARHFDHLFMRRP